MRLLKLKVKNIASLKGEHVISFEEISQHSNLFAITGETGAGKSSILNSVGLALYGDIFKKTLNQIDVVTLGEFEGLIELIFQVRGKKYLAYWYVRTRKPNGEAYAKVPTPTRLLYTLEGDDFSSERTITEEKVEDLLNLDFDQFSKCVVLNQGEFAKFLMSSFPERRAILEKLYPGELLGNIVKVLKEELESLRVQKEHLEIELKAIADEGQSLGNIEENLKTLKRELALHESWAELMEKLFTGYQTLLHYHEKNIENEKRIESTRKELATGTTSYNVLLKATEAAQIRREADQKNFDERGPRLQALLKSEETLWNEKSRMELLQKDERSFRTEMIDLEERIERLKKEEEKLLPEREENAAKMKFPLEAIIAHRDLINDLVDRNEEILKIRNTLDLEKERLSTLESRGKDIAVKFQEIDEKLKLIPDNINDELKLLQKKKEDSHKALARGTEVSSQISQCEGLISELILGLKERKEKAKASQEELVTVLSTLKVQELLSAVSVCLFHPQTEEKNICPVCENPFAKGKLQDLKILAGSFNLGRLQEKSDKLHAEIVKLETEIELQTKTLTDEQKKLSLLKQEKEKLLTLGSGEDLDAEINRVQKLVYDRAQLLPLFTTTESELKKVRLEYRDAKGKLTTKESELLHRTKLFHESASAVSEFVPDFSEEILPALRLDLRLSVLISELDGMIERHRHDVNHWSERKVTLTTNLAALEIQKTEVAGKIHSLNEELTK
jgi:exonuclease SbcC